MVKHTCSTQWLLFIQYMYNIRHNSVINMTWTFLYTAYLQEFTHLVSVQGLEVGGWVLSPARFIDCTPLAFFHNSHTSSHCHSYHSRVFILSTASLLRTSPTYKLESQMLPSTKSLALSTQILYLTLAFTVWCCLFLQRF